jgi:hypothetical protein
MQGGVADPATIKAGSAIPPYTHNFFVSTFELRPLSS